MLFLKEIIDKKFNERDFREFFEKECHICSTTVKVIALLEEKKDALSDILDTLHISKKAYKGLKEGEHCDPATVKQLCTYLGFQDPGLFKNCRKLK